MRGRAATDLHFSNISWVGGEDAMLGSPQDVGAPHMSNTMEGLMLASTFRILAVSAALSAAVVFLLTVPTV